MSADLHIHVMEGIDEATLAAFFSNHIGSKHFRRCSQVEKDEAYEKVAKTPAVWIGEVSWLCAVLLGGNYVPPTVSVVRALIGESLPVLDERLEDRLLDALTLDNPTDYRIAEQEQVASFLAAHRGKRLFTVSW
jgi:hypothetical protein